MCYTQVCNVNQHQCFTPMMKNPEEGQNCIVYHIECMQETATHIPNYIFSMELSLDAPWAEEEGAERKTEGEWEFKGDTSHGLHSVVYGHKILGLRFPSTLC